VGIQGTENDFHSLPEDWHQCPIPESKNSKSLVTAESRREPDPSVRPSPAFRAGHRSASITNWASERNEIDDVTPDRRLSPEVEAESLQFAQLYPQFDFLRRKTFTKCASISFAKGTPPDGLRPATLPTRAHKGGD